METLAKHTGDIRIRKFEISDLPQVAEIRNASIAISPDFYSMTVDRVRPPSDASDLQLTSEILVAEVNGAVRGYVHLYTDPSLMSQGRVNIDALHVHPDEQRSGVGTLLIKAAIQKGQEWGGRYLSIAIPAGVVSSQTFLLKHDFQLVRYFWKLRHADLADLPAPSLPEGFSFRSFRQGIDEDAFLGLLNAAFAEHWDFAPVNRGELERWKQRPDFNPRGSFFVTHDGRDVAVATVLIDRQMDAETHEGAARIFEFGVLPEFRGKALGYNILLKAAQFARDEELPALELIVDGHNDQAKAMYERVGFQQKRAILVFHKAI
ncbi:GNAT family N-acetyltransferase [bacterium]|nr:GNAT family N-acetyltransferase [bacterium]